MSAILRGLFGIVRSAVRTRRDLALEHLGPPSSHLRAETSSRAWKPCFASMGSIDASEFPFTNVAGIATLSPDRRASGRDFASTGHGSEASGPGRSDTGSPADPGLDPQIRSHSNTRRVRAAGGTARRSRSDVPDRMIGPAHHTDRGAQLLHLRVGDAALFGFAALGVALESLYAFKAPWYLGVAGDRRFLFTLAQAQGLGLGLVNLELAAALPLLPGRPPAATSACLVAGRLPIPTVFFAGGLFAHGSDPAPGALPAPRRALLVVITLGLVLRAALARDRS